MDDAKTGVVMGHVFKPGDWVGEIPALTGTHRQIGTTALRDGRLLTVPMQKMRDICATHPQGWKWLALLLAINNGVAVQIARNLLISDHPIWHRGIPGGADGLLIRVGQVYSCTRCKAGHLPS